MAWLDKSVDCVSPLAPADVQATLNHLTAEQVDNALPEYIDILVVCGGGVHNAHLMGLIDETVDPLVVTSDAFAVDPDYVEAACFGWLGLQCLDHRPLDTQHITGSKTPGILGSITRPVKD